MTTDNKYVKEDKEFESINGLYLHIRKDGLFYKKHAKKPFTGLALTYGEKGRLICRTHFKDGKIQRNNCNERNMTYRSVNSLREKMQTI